MKRLFGTDGIRGEAGRPPLDQGTISRIGAALASVLSRESEAPRIIIGRDTRESGSWIEEAIARGIAGAGGRATIAGVITTAGVAWLTRTHGFDAGVMISASHNPFHDNGIKIFSREGYKLPDSEEARIESIVLEAGGEIPTPSGAPVAVSIDGDLSRDYVEGVVNAAGGTRLEGMQVVLDCANGASCQEAPEAFEVLGARVHRLGDRPDGRNINEGFGSMHPEAASRAVVETGAQVGFAFDGDADRCIVVDDRGQVCDGDFILYRSALAMREAGRLPGDVVVGTVMSNLWLQKALEASGIRLLRTGVGDKYVLEEMRRSGARLGGEQSGHVIFLDHATTGDGILTAVMMACIRKRAGVPLSRWRSEVRPFPQILLNERIASKPEMESHPVIGPAAEEVRKQLGSSGRLLLRYSGTEPLVRVMIEGEDAGQIESLARDLAALIRREIGGA